MLDFARDFDGIKDNAVGAIINAKHAAMEAFQWEVPLAVEKTIQALWGKREMKPKLVWPERKLLKTLKTPIPALRTDHGWQFIFELPPGYKFDDLLNAEAYFRTAAKGRSTFMEVKGGAVYLHIMNDQLGTNYLYDANAIAAKVKDEAIPFAVGMAHNGLLMVDLADSPSLLVWGPVGLGKTTILRSLITTAIRHRQEDVRVIVFDRKEVDFWFCQHQAEIYTELEDIQGACEALAEELNRRKKLLRKADCENLKLYRVAHPEEKLPYYLIVIDEFAELAESKDVVKLVDHLIRLGRAGGFSLVVCSQRTTSDMSEKIGSIKLNCNMKIALHMSEMNSRLILDSNKAALIPAVKGRGVLSWKDNDIEFQAMNIPVKTATGLLKNLPPKGWELGFTDTCLAPRQ